MKITLILAIVMATLFVGCESTEPNPEISSSQAAGRISKTALTAYVLRIRMAANTYRSVNGAYPDNVQALVDDGHIHPGQELDPWGTPFALQDESGTLVITSYGADKKPGGEDENRDRVSRGVDLR
ncbi:MAG: hypothetical protein BMS9Abin37_1851 [Acidobacteriota bacterium]|nr:MAG: hypothetical protein BMS9Abin37_1851 [Acidobacteriota bacterium]